MAGLPTMLFAVAAVTLLAACCTAAPSPDARPREAKSADVKDLQGAETFGYGYGYGYPLSYSSYYYPRYRSYYPRYRHYGYGYGYPYYSSYWDDWNSYYYW